MQETRHQRAGVLQVEEQVLGRDGLARGGQVWAHFCGLIRKTVEAASAQAQLQSKARALEDALRTLDEAVQHMGVLDPADAAGGACDMLTATGTGTVVIAWHWLETGLALSRPEVAQNLGADFIRRKQVMTQLWTSHELPLASAACRIRVIWYRRWATSSLLRQLGTACSAASTAAAHRD